MKKVFFVVPIFLFFSCSFFEDEQNSVYTFTRGWIVSTSDWEKPYSEITKDDLVGYANSSNTDAIRILDSLAQIILENPPIPDQDNILVHVKTFYNGQEVLPRELFSLGMPVNLVRNGNVYRNVLPLILVWGHVELADSSYRGHIILPVSPRTSDNSRSAFSIKVIYPFNINASGER
ncbi:MAG: hypothetical protein FWE23_00235 [Chitinivibrionia bacterium]|nr:hypothetical protein [Chitinivibrionia bacterium]